MAISNGNVSEHRPPQADGFAVSADVIIFSSFPHMSVKLEASRVQTIVIE
jgi:hypothetical protein